MRNRNFFKAAVIFFVCFVCFYSTNSQAGKHDQLVNDEEWAAVKKAVLPLEEQLSELQEAANDIYRRLAKEEGNATQSVEEVAQLRAEVARLTKNNEAMQATLGFSDPNTGTVSSTRLDHLDERVTEVEDNLAEVKVEVFYIHFAPGGNSSVENSPDAKEVLARLQDGKYTSVLRIVGNASTEWDGLPEAEANEKNSALAMERAKAVKEYLSSAGIEVPDEKELSAVVSNRYGTGTPSRVVAIYATR